MKTTSNELNSVNFGKDFRSGKINVLLTTLIIGATLATSSTFAYHEDKISEDHNPAQELSLLPFESISTVERIGLIKMREEEKLARDVYLTLYDKWGTQIFSNIARSEQRHTDVIKSLLDKYSILDPVLDDTIGVFTDKKLLNLYNDLVQQGSDSLIEALKVGATIEDLDIYDLKEFLAETDNQDLTKVYQNLERGSRNHLRAFNRQLLQNNASYSAQFLSQDEYNSIANSKNEKGRNCKGKLESNRGSHGKGKNRVNSTNKSFKRGQWYKGQGRRMGQRNGSRFNQDASSQGKSFNKVKPRQRQWRNLKKRGGRQSNGKNNLERNHSFSGQSRNDSRNFYHFFARFFGQ